MILHFAVLDDGTNVNNLLFDVCEDEKSLKYPSEITNLIITFNIYEITKSNMRKNYYIQYS
jgi:hypothetical protein